MIFAIAPYNVIHLQSYTAIYHGYVGISFEKWMLT